MVSTSRQTRRLALLRAINLGGRNKVPMAELRALASELGWLDVSTFIASGNLLFRSDKSDADCAATLTSALAERFGFGIDVIVVGASEFREAVDRHPFADGDPQRVHLGLCSAPMSDAAAAKLAELAVGNERIAADGVRLYADFADGVHSSKLANRLASVVRPGFVTLRNVATSRTLADLLAD